MIFTIAHRGASGYEPENTVRAFRRAIALKADMIECDVQLTKDNHVIIMHDSRVNRTTNGRGRVSQLTLQQIRTLDAGNGDKVPTLEETIQVTRGKCQLNVEIKKFNAVERVVKIITKKRAASHVIISSENPLVLLKAQILNPAIRRAIIVGPAQFLFNDILIDFYCWLSAPFTKHIIVRQARMVGVRTIHLYHKFASAEVVHYVQKKGFKVNVWTVNNKKELKKYKKMRVNGIFTNYPDWL